MAKLFTLAIIVLLSVYIVRGVKSLVETIKNKKKVPNEGQTDKESDTPEA